MGQRPGQTHGMGDDQRALDLGHMGLAVKAQIDEMMLEIGQAGGQRFPKGRQADLPHQVHRGAPIGGRPVPGASGQVGRVVRGVGPGIAELGALLQRHADYLAGRVNVQKVTIFASTLTADGPIYDVLGTAQLGGA